MSALSVRLPESLHKYAKQYAALAQVPDVAPDQRDHR